MNRKILFISVSLILIVLLGIGVSYSLWNMTVSQDKVNTAYTECFDVSITSENNNIDLENTYPITNELGKKLTPYSFTITNTCDIFASYTVNLESLKSTTLPSKFLNVMINNEEIKKLSEYESTDIVNNGSLESHILAKGSLGSGDSVDYTLRLWIDYGTTMEDLDNETKIFKSKVIVVSQPSNWDPVSAGYTTLHDAILANEYQTTPEIAIKKIEAKVTPDLTKTAPTINWKEIESDEITTISSTKLASSAIKSDTQTNNLTQDSTLLHIFSSKNVNNDNGMIELSNNIVTDPTTLDYNGDNKYYFIQEKMYYNTTDNRIYETYWHDDIIAYEIQLASKENVMTTWNNKSYDSIKYNLKVKKISLQKQEQDNSDKGLYKSNDDYGTTYYYRGNVTNNYVKFADFYWKIIRINGDGSIRLIYNGNNTKTSIGESEYNNTKNSPAYVGYMYGNDISSRSNAIKNENDSTIKGYLDNWYKNNLENYKKVISDSGFCNDRSISSGDGYSTNKYTYYKAYSRYGTNDATFICNDTNDLFTTTNSLNGNKALTYPIGLITADEITYAGLNLGVNSDFYLNNGGSFRTMTPTIYGTISQTADTAIYYGGKFFSSYGVTSEQPIRPVINLTYDTKIISGIGTINNPFTIDIS